MDDKTDVRRAAITLFFSSLNLILAVVLLVIIVSKHGADDVGIKKVVAPMNVKIERTGKHMLTVQENDGEKFYCLYDILNQTGRTPEALKKNQTPINLDCRIIYGYRYTGEDFLTSVFVDEEGLKQLAGD